MVWYIADIRKWSFFIATLLETMPASGVTLHINPCDNVHLLMYVCNPVWTSSYPYVCGPRTQTEILHVIHSSYYFMLD